MMNRAAFHHLGRSSATLRSRSASICQIVTYCLLTVLVAVSGCRSVEPARELPVERPESEAAPPQPLPVPDEQPKQDVLSEPESQSLEHSCETVWAAGFRGELIVGVDGALYEPYSRFAIERVQRALRR